MMTEFHTYSVPSQGNIIQTAYAASLLEQACQGPDGPNLYANRVADFEARDATLHIVEDRTTKQIAGFAATTELQGHVTLFSVLVTAPFRGQGVGGLIVDQAIKDSIQHGATDIELEIRLTDKGLPPAALRLYRSRNFVLLPGVLVIPIGFTHRDRHLWRSSEGGVFRERRMRLNLGDQSGGRAHG